MSITTVVAKLTPEERKEKIARLRDSHQSYFDSIKEPKSRFTAKMKFGYNADCRTKFFESELSSDAPLYVEWVSRDYNPEDDGKLYLYEYTPNYKTEFKQEALDTGTVMYLVPISKFKLVHDPIVAKKESIEQLAMDFDLSGSNEDCPIMDMTLRDFAALMMVSPVSRKEWLNKIITSCQK